MCTVGKGEVKQFHYRPGQALRVPEVEAPRFQHNRHMKMVRSALRTGRLYRPGNILVLISVRGQGNPRAIVRPEGSCQWKITLKPSGIETATFRLVVQCHSQLSHRVPQTVVIYTFMVLIVNLLVIINNKEVFDIFAYLEADCLTLSPRLYIRVHSARQNYLLAYFTVSPCILIHWILQTN